MKHNTIKPARDEALEKAAMAAMENAYAPYSNFPVGAAIRTESGNIFTGCNVENAAYPLGNCAEASAIAAMVNAGERRIKSIAIAGNGDALVTPCGGCRQRIAEFAEANTPILICNQAEWRESFDLQSLLPHQFNLVE